MDELLSFKVDRRCEKCGHDEARWEYVKADTAFIQNEGPCKEEHHRKKCKRCGFEWCEKVISQEELKMPPAAEREPLNPADFSNRAYKRLIQAGITTIQDLANTPVTKLLSMPGMGQGSVLEIERKLNQRGLYLRKC